MGHLTLTRPLPDRVGLVTVNLYFTVNLYTKYEVSRCTRYKAMNGSAKCRKWGSLGWSGGHAR